MGTVEDPLECLTKIGEKVKPIGHLQSAWCPSCCPTDVFWSAVTGNDGDARMLS